MSIETEKYTGLSLEELRKQQEKRKKKYEPSISADFEGEAREKVIASKRPDVLTFDKMLFSVDAFTNRPQKQLKQVMEYSAARVVFWQILKKRKANVSNGNYVVKDESRDNSKIIENLVKYFINDESGDYDLKKGLLLAGDVGTGKTFLMQSLAVFANVVQNKKFRIGICNEIYDGLLQSSYDNKKGGINLKKYFSGHWCFDDIGDESAEFLHYGNPVRPMDRIITERYKNWVNGWCLTHGTTNLKGDELEAKYGKRVRDRMREMFNAIYLEGNSFR